MYAWPMIWATMRRLSRSPTTGPIGLCSMPPAERFMMWTPISSKRRKISLRCSAAGRRLRGGPPAPPDAAHDSVALPLRGHPPARMAVLPREAVELDALRPHARRADHVRRGGRDREEIAADAVRRLAVEHALGGHRAETPDDQPH